MARRIFNPVATCPDRVYRLLHCTHAQSYNPLDVHMEHDMFYVDGAFPSPQEMKFTCCGSAPELWMWGCKATRRHFLQI